MVFLFLSFEASVLNNAYSYNAGITTTACLLLKYVSLACGHYACDFLHVTFCDGLISSLTFLCCLYMHAGMGS